MCGIAGIYYYDDMRRAEREMLVTMRDTMAHRGPDDEGIYLDKNIGLVHRRLSIIGVETGAQPMSNGDESLCIVYNGETYNYREIRRDLERKGYKFRTDSDTEVILHLYDEYGEDCVEHMNGMFAFAIWDRRSRKVFLARDRLGIKPIYYCATKEAFVFASEIKAINACSHYKPAIESSAVYEYFMFRGVSGERTLFDGVMSLLPGHCMTISNDGIAKKQYWTHDVGARSTNINVEDAAEELDELLNDAVKIRLMSEVPLGTFCSGGVDSSLLTAIAARHVGQPINTFSVGFHESGYDETSYARLVSSKYGTQHHEVRLTSREFADALPKLIYLNDEPLHFANSVHIFAVSQLAKQFVTVVLTGEGADELFCGYPRYHIPRIVRKLQANPAIYIPLLKLAHLVTRDHRFEKILMQRRRDTKDLILMNGATNALGVVDRVMRAGVERNIEFRTDVARFEGEENDLLDMLSVSDQQTYLVSILNRQDKMSMGASVEARVPFIDYRIVEFANRLHSRAKTRGLGTKQIVKRVAERYLPKDVVHRRKSGFGVPLKQWFMANQPLGNLAAELFSTSDDAEYINVPALEEILIAHQKNHKDYSEILWTAVNFLKWKSVYGL